MAVTINEQRRLKVTYLCNDSVMTSIVTVCNNTFKSAKKAVRKRFAFSDSIKIIAISAGPYRSQAISDDELDYFIARKY